MSSGNTDKTRAAIKPWLFFGASPLGIATLDGHFSLTRRSFSDYCRSRFPAWLVSSLKGGAGGAYRKCNPEFSRRENDSRPVGT
jgi:hypothetical protein